MAPLVDAQAAASSQMSGRLAAQIAALLAGFTGWYDDQAVAALAARIAGLVAPVQRATAALTDAYLARTATTIRGRSVRPAGPIPVAGLRAGVSLADAYSRLAGQYRYEVSQGTSPADALEHVTVRAEVMAGTDTALAMRGQSRKFMVERRVTGWRRVIHPELSKGGTCGLCIVASHRLYKADDLMPLHARCSCVPTPVYGDDDPGSAINAADLKAIYAAAGSTDAADLKRTRYTVHQHSELGPQLVEAKAAWRGPAQVRADSTH
ncbi:MAG: hypothetical protein ACR2GG_10665 [Gemmatimonadaceae bacterium]